MLVREFRSLAVALVSVVTLVTVPAVAAAAQSTTTIKMSYNGPPKVSKNPVHRFATDFKKLVKLKTGGKIDIKLYPNSQLGKESARMEQVTSGPMIDVASLAGMQSVFTPIFAGNEPFMFQTYAAAHWFYDNGQYWKRAQKAFHKKTGAYLLDAVEDGGFLAFTNSVRPIHSPKDFKGLKFRAMTQGQVALYKAFGASGIPVPWTETYTALKTGVADGQMNPPTYIISGSLNEVQKYLTMAKIQYSMQFLVVNGAWLDGLPKAQQKAIRQSAHEANAINRIWVEANVKRRVNYLKQHGMKVYYPTHKQLHAFKAKGQPAYSNWVKKKVAQKWIDLAQQSASKANQQTSQ